MWHLLIKSVMENNITIIVACTPACANFIRFHICETAFMRDLCARFCPFKSKPGGASSGTSGGGGGIGSSKRGTATVITIGGGTGSWRKQRASQKKKQSTSYLALDDLSRDEVTLVSHDRTRPESDGASGDDAEASPGDGPLDPRNVRHDAVVQRVQQPPRVYDGRGILRTYEVDQQSHHVGGGEADW
jgi:hypothetical protein